MVKSHKPHSKKRTAKRDTPLSKTTGLRIGAIIGTALVGFTGAVSSIALPGYAQTSSPLPEVEPATKQDSSLSDDVRFECQLNNGQFTVMYLPESQPGQAYAWATPVAMGGGWDAEKRCYTISERLEAYRPEGLAELQVGIENGYDIVCATTEQIPGLCKIVFTVPPGQDPVITRDLVFENLTLADGGTDTTIVNTYTGAGGPNVLDELGQVLGDFTGFPSSGQSARRNDPAGINLKPFLDSADGGTGTAIKKSRTPSRTLSPDNFR